MVMRGSPAARHKGDPPDRTGQRPLGDCPQEDETDGLIDAFEYKKRRFRQMGEDLEMN